MSDTLNPAELPPPDGNWAGDSWYTAATVNKIVAEAIAADRALLAKSAAPNVKTWQERMPEHVRFLGTASSQIPYMEAEIADLRAQLAQQDQGEDIDALIKQFGLENEVAEHRDATRGMTLTQAEQYVGAVMTPASAQPAEQVGDVLADWTDKLNGMLVSMDVSTGDTDAYNRVFGRVVEVMLKSCGAAEDTILAIEESRNFGADGPLPNEPKPCRQCDPSVGYMCEEHAAPQPAARAAVPDGARAFLMSQDLYSLLLDIQNGIDSPATCGTANKLIIQLDKARAMLAASPATVTAPAQPAERAKELVEQYRTGYRHGYEEGKAEMVAPAAQQAAPTLYVRQVDIDGTMPGKTVLASKVSAEDWTIPLFSAAPATAGMVGQDAKDAAFKVPEGFLLVGPGEIRGNFEAFSTKANRAAERLGTILADEIPKRATLAAQQAQANVKDDEKGAEQ